MAALAAWLECAVAPSDPWPAVVDAVAARTAAALDARAALLGLPIAALASVPEVPTPAFDLPIAARHLGRSAAHSEALTVLDLTSLWAGPLCAQLLSWTGARVIKVESSRRPDGARFGPKGFFDLLNATKASVVLDLGSPHDVRQLGRLIASADVVIESSRPRALAQLGLVVTDLLRDAAPTPGLGVVDQPWSHGLGGGAGRLR